MQSDTTATRNGPASQNAGPLGTAVVGGPDVPYFPSTGTLLPHLPRSAIRWGRPRVRTSAESWWRTRACAAVVRRLACTDPRPCRRSSPPRFGRATRCSVLRLSSYCSQARLLEGMARAGSAARRSGSASTRIASAEAQLAWAGLVGLAWREQRPGCGAWFRATQRSTASGCLHSWTRLLQSAQEHARAMVRP
jgi:hypothetical protein